jgi:hypothetical protein
MRSSQIRNAMSGRMPSARIDSTLMSGEIMIAPSSANDT